LTLLIVAYAATHCPPPHGILKAGKWLRRGRLLMASPVHGDYRRCQAEIPLIVLSEFPRPALTGKVKGRWWIAKTL
jgi:hypothetical protein